MSMRGRHASHITATESRQSENATMAGSKEAQTDTATQSKQSDSATETESKNSESVISHDCSTKENTTRTQSNDFFSSEGGKHEHIQSSLHIATRMDGAPDFTVEQRRILSCLTPLEPAAGVTNVSTCPAIVEMSMAVTANKDGLGTLGVLPLELWWRAIPAKRVVMLRSVSKTVRAEMERVREAGATVMVKEIFFQDIQGLAKRLLNMQKWCRIQELVMHRPRVNQAVAIRIGAKGAEMLVGVLDQCISLVHLNFSCHDVGVAGARTLAEVLGQNLSLAYLDLGDNNIGAEGAERLSRVLGQLPLLAHLDLSSNRIGDEGAGRLAGVLGRSSLAHLNLAHNGIGAEGAEKLSRVLGQCASLSHLKLGRNNIGDEGAGKLAGVLG